MSWKTGLTHATNETSWTKIVIARDGACRGCGVTKGLIKLDDATQYPDPDYEY